MVILSEPRGFADCVADVLLSDPPGATYEDTFWGSEGSLWGPSAGTGLRCGSESQDPAGRAVTTRVGSPCPRRFSRGLHAEGPADREGKPQHSGPATPTELGSEVEGGGWTVSESAASDWVGTENVRRCHKTCMRTAGLKPGDCEGQPLHVLAIPVLLLLPVQRLLHCSKRSYRNPFGRNMAVCTRERFMSKHLTTNDGFRETETIDFVIS